MNRIISLFTLLLAATTLMAQTTYTGATPEAGRSYYVQNVGRGTFLSTTGGELSMGGFPLVVTVTARRSNTTDFMQADDGYVTLATGTTHLAASPFLRPRSDGQGKYSDWTLQPTGSDDSYALACRFHDGQAAAYVYYSTLRGYPRTMSQRPDKDFADGLWRLVPTSDVQFVTLDEASTAYTVPTLRTGLSAANVLLRREFALNMWNTLCVPFDIDDTQLKAQLGDDVQLLRFTGTDGTTLYFNYSTTVEAGVPYLVKPTQNYAEGKEYYEFDGVGTFTAQPQTVRQTATAAQGGQQVSYIASFVKTTAPQGAYVLYHDEVYHLVSPMTMKAFRGYFVSGSGSEAKRITQWAIGDVPTGISTVNVGEPGNGRHDVYNLQGQRLGNADRLSHGVYIINGKKVIK